MEEERRIQLAIIEAVNQFCKKNGITYFLAYGSLLGAVRNNGYIPWDDDVDIIMFREDYERFLREFSHAIFKVYSLQTNVNCRYPFAKVLIHEQKYLKGHFIPQAIMVSISISSRLIKFLNQGSSNLFLCYACGSCLRY